MDLPHAPALSAARLRLRLPLPWAVLLGCFALVALSTGRVVATDTYFDLYAGRFIAAHGLPAGDPFTVAGHGRPWVDQQWLAHLAYYGAWRLGGYALVGALASLLVAGAFAAIAALARRRGAGAGSTGAAVALAAVAAVPASIVWAQDFAYPLFAATLWLLGAAGRRRLLVLPLLMLWANLHGSVLVGVALVAAAAALRAARALRAGERPKGLDVAIGLLAPLAALTTPYGPAATLAYYRSVLANPVLSSELDLWKHASPTDPGSVAFALLAVAGGVLVGLALRRGARPSPALAVLAALLALAGLDAVRYQVWFLLLWPLPAAEAATLAGIPAVGRRALRRAAAVAVAALAALAAVALVATGPASFERTEPAGAVAAAARAAGARPHALVLADTSAASPLLWHYPALAGRVGFDPRVEIFAPKAARAWFAWNELRPGSAALQRRYGVLVAGRRAHPALAGALERLAGWRVVYRGADGVVAVRRAPAGAAPPR